MPKDLLTPEETDNRLAYVVGTVVEDYFSNDVQESGGKADYENADRTQRYWKVQIDDVQQDWDGQVPDHINVKFGLGDGWFPNEDGTAVRHQDDTDEENPKLFNNRSRFGQLLALITGQKRAYVARRVVVLDGGPEEVEYDMRGAEKYLRSEEMDDPRMAGVFTGTRWEFRGLGFDYGTRPGEQERELRATVVPTKFLGTAGDQLATRTTGKKSEVTTEQVTELLSEIGPVHHEALAKLVNTSTSASQFKRNALALAGDDEALKAAIMDTDSGPWSLRGA